MLAENLVNNPLAEPFASKIADPCILIIFGATGDLTARKLLPALYNLTREGQLPSHFACVGFARRQKTDEQFRLEIYDDLSKHSRVKPVDQELWASFSEQLFYYCASFDEENVYQNFDAYLQDLDMRFGTRGNRIFYLSTPPSHFPGIIEYLGKYGLIYNPNQDTTRWSRVIIEKPFGHDLCSAYALQQEISHYLREDQIFRIDHYLGKETVQNLLVIRFANPIFESIWNNRYIDHVQITVAEEMGVGTRGRFYEEAGMLKDIIQNHMMQLVSLVAMEPPVSIDANAIRDEKVKVLQSIRPISVQDVDKSVVRGQYGPGFVNGEVVKGYRYEDNVSHTSVSETFVALELFVDNWRWAGVPFYLRAGKRLPKRATEIAVYFKPAPGILFTQHASEDATNALVIRIQPDEGVSLKMNSKVPGINNPIQPVKMDFRYGSYFGATPPEAYERLICDCILGDSTLFARQDEVLTSWKLLEPIIEHWKAITPQDFPNYAAGTWGPQQAEELLLRNGRRWRFL